MSTPQEHSDTLPSHNHRQTGMALVFPGQGSQCVGMAVDVWRHYGEACDTFLTAAQEWSELPLKRLLTDETSAELNLTIHAQPALLVASLLLWQGCYLQKGLADPLADPFSHQRNDKDAPLGMNIMALAGHSLGEYTALVVSGMLSASDAVKLVAARGRAMHIAGRESSGGMLAVLGLDASCITDTLSRHPNIKAYSANDNAPGQIIISGEESALIECAPLLEKSGGRIRRLEVSAPFHCPLMHPAQEAFTPTLNATPFHASTLPIVSNVTATFQRNPDTVRALLHEQIVAPVLWRQSIEYMLETQTITTFVEIGPGRVLTGLIKRIAKAKKATPVLHSLATLKDIQSTLSE